MVALVIAILAFIISVIALVIALKRKNQTTVVTKTEVIHAPVDHPFVYDEKAKAYRVNGSLYATGFLSALKINKEE